MKVNRRDFLKFTSLLPVIASQWPLFLESNRSSGGSKTSPNILVILFDALSARNASIYGYQRATTPNLERFASRAIVYHNYYSPGNFTTSGTASLLTGTYPWTHRAIQMLGSIAPGVVPNNLFRLFGGKGYTRLGYSHNLLATELLHQFSEDMEIFKFPRELSLDENQFSDRIFSKDYSVAFLGEKLMLPLETTPPASLFLALISGWVQTAKKRKIFEEYKDRYPEGVPDQYRHYYLLETAIDWVIDLTIKLPQPYLAYVHLLPPHEPYWPRKEFTNWFQDDWKPLRKPRSFFSQGYSQKSLNQSRNEYDDYIANVDAEFGRLYASMEKSGVLENTMIIFTSDHGELFERGIRGHLTDALYQPILQVPLLISMPGQRQREDVYVNTSGVDLLPTLLHVAGIAAPELCEGKVLPPFSRTNDANDRNIFSLEAKQNPKMAPLTNASVSLIKGDYKLIHYLGYDDDVPEYELFDLANDPEELSDRIKASKGVAQELQDILQAKLKEVNQRYL